MAEIPPAAQSVNEMVAGFHNLAASHEPIGATVGKILAPPPDIKIAWNNIILTKEQVYIDEYWLIGHRREAKGHIKSGTQGANCGCGGFHSHGIDNDYTDDIIYTDTLKPGDFVSVFPVNGGQLFIVTSKLIYLGGGTPQ